MARGPVKWTEKKIQEMEAAGFGKGVGADYNPWVTVESFSSLGRSRRVWSHKTGRTHHLLSDVEYRLFLSLEWQLDTVDIREQYPLDRNLTQDVARNLSIRHPFYPGTHVPAVMSVDFLVTKQLGAERVVEAFNAKRDEEAEDEESLLKLEVQREYFEQMGVPHHVIYHSQIPKQNVDNIDWIREALLKPGEEEPRPGYFGALSARMASELAQMPNRSASLASYCRDFEANHGLERGTGLRTARILMQDRVLKANLSSFDLAAEPLSTFVVTGQHGKLRAVGGA
jgi:hypothetical protein